MRVNVKTTTTTSGVLVRLTTCKMLTAILAYPNEAL